MATVYYCFTNPYFSCVPSDDPVAISLQHQQLHHPYVIVRAIHLRQRIVPEYLVPRMSLYMYTLLADWTTIKLHCKCNNLDLLCIHVYSYGCGVHVLT